MNLCIVYGSKIKWFWNQYLQSHPGEPRGHLPTRAGGCTTRSGACTTTGTGACTTRSGACTTFPGECTTTRSGACTTNTLQSHLCNTPRVALSGVCLLYTSDAADERSSVDLGGR